MWAQMKRSSTAHPRGTSLTWLRGYNPCLLTPGAWLGTQELWDRHPQYQSFPLDASRLHLQWISCESLHNRASQMAAAARHLNSINCNPALYAVASTLKQTDINSGGDGLALIIQVTTEGLAAGCSLIQQQQTSDERNGKYLLILIEPQVNQQYVQMLATVATSSYAPFLWDMCFSGRPFLYGIQIFFRGFWVSSRGFDGVLSSSIPSCGEVEAAAAGTRGLFPWCCSEGDRCFIRAALRGWRRSGRSVPLSVCRCHVFRAGHSGIQRSAVMIAIRAQHVVCFTVIDISCARPQNTI